MSFTVISLKNKLLAALLSSFSEV